MDAVFDAFATVMAFFYDLVPSYAFAITGLTLVVMVIVTPLTLKGTRSMMVMQQLQPEIRKIQTQYKDDRTKLNEELLKFYKENNLNPVGGCLPLLVQMPVFLVLYQVLRGLTRRESGLGFDTGWVSGQLGLGQQPSTPPAIERPFDPAFLNPESSMYQSLHGSTTMAGPLGMDLAESAQQALSDGIVEAIPYLLLILIVGATGFIQQRQIQGRNPGAQINPQQQMIMRIMPFFLPVISFTLPSGLVLYFAVSNLYRIGQQAFISRSIYGMSRADMKANRSGSTGDGRKGKQEKPATKASVAKKRPAKKSDAEDAVEEPKEGKSSGRSGGSTPGNEQTAKDEPGTGKQATGTKKSSTGAGARRSGRVTPKAEQAGGGKSQPALQPRARKNKKR